MFVFCKPGALSSPPYFPRVWFLTDNNDLPLKEDSQRISRERRHVTGSENAGTESRQQRDRRQVIRNNLFVEYGIVADHKNYQRCGLLLHVCKNLQSENISMKPNADVTFLQMVVHHQ